MGLLQCQVSFGRTFCLQPQLQMVVEYASDTLRAVCLTAPSANIIDREKKVRSDDAQTQTRSSLWQLRSFDSTRDNSNRNCRLRSWELFSHLCLDRCRHGRHAHRLLRLPSVCVFASMSFQACTHQSWRSPTGPVLDTKLHSTIAKSLIGALFYF